MLCRGPSTSVDDPIGKGSQLGCGGKMPQGDRPSQEEGTLDVLFVCTGNICRSPTAERLAMSYAASLRRPNLAASSAGTRAVVGHAIHQEASRVLSSLGGDSAEFRARQLTPKIASRADLILTMTRAHRDDVLELAPQKLSRTFTLREASLLVSECGASVLPDLANLRSHLVGSRLLDIQDPMGHGADVFARVGSEIAELLPSVMDLCARST